MGKIDLFVMQRAYTPDDAQLRFAQDFSRATEPTMMEDPGIVSGVWEKHVTIKYRVWDKNSLVLAEIFATPAGQRHGGKGLRFLCGLADKHKLSIKLNARPIGYEAQSRLRDECELLGWYKQHGFTRTDSGTLMIRIPA